MGAILCRVAAMLSTVVVSLVLFSGCSEPSVSEVFAPVSDADSSGWLHLDLDMSHPDAKYDISFFSRIDCSRSRFENITSFPLDVRMASPSGIEYCETVYIPLDMFGKDGCMQHDFCVEYRTSCVPRESGLWKMSVRPPEMQGLRGIGVILERNN